MKRICISTWFSAPNYGTFLQAFSLQKFLEIKDCKTDIVNFKPQSFLYSDIRIILFKLFPFLKKYKRYSYSKYLFEKEAKKYMSLSKRVTLSNVRPLIDNYDVFISGSDQIWNPDGAFHRFYMYEKIPNDKFFISYASSTGGNLPTKEKDQDYKELLEKYNYISVREDRTRDYISDLLNRSDILKVLDPVFLLNKKEWDMFSNIDVPYDNYIFVYFLGFQDFYLDKISSLHEMYPELKFLMVCLGNEPEIDLSYVKQIYGVSPFYFLALLKNANFVITDSFHATVFSIIFEKKFYHFLRYDNSVNSQNNRVFDLLSSLNYENVIIDSKVESCPKVEELKIIKSNDLSDEIEKSKKFLSRALGGFF